MTYAWIGPYCGQIGSYNALQNRPYKKCLVIDRALELKQLTVETIKINCYGSTTRIIVF